MYLRIIILLLGFALVPKVVLADSNTNAHSTYNKLLKQIISQQTIPHFKCQNSRQIIEQDEKTEVTQLITMAVFLELNGYKSLDKYPNTVPVAEFSKFAEHFLSLKKNKNIRWRPTPVKEGWLGDIPEVIDSTSQYDKDALSHILENQSQKFGERAFLPTMCTAYLHYMENLNDLPCGLSPLQKFTISLYGDGVFSLVNSYLRSEKKPRLLTLELFTDELNRALAKIEPFQGYVLRQDRTSTAVWGQYNVGDRITYSAFTSTSAILLPNYPPNVIIRSESGVLIAPLSSWPSEQEVLFPSNTSFRILYNSCMKSQDIKVEPCQIVLEETL